MHIIINNSSMQPLYDQIVEQVKALIIRGELSAEKALPSVRSLAKDLKISALTVKKSYDRLEEEGFIITVHGKGSFVAPLGGNLAAEESRRQVESDLEAAIRKGMACGMDTSEISNLFQLIMEDM